MGINRLQRGLLFVVMVLAMAGQGRAQVNGSGGGNPCHNNSAILQSTGVTTSGTSAVQVIALSSTTKIFICSLTVIGQSGTSPTFSLVQGTGTNCATSQTVVVPAFATPANTLFAFSTPVSVGVAGNALCYLQTGTSPVTKVQLTWVQQ